MRVFFALVLLLVSVPVFAADDGAALMAETPVLHEGRVKPLDSVARIMLRDFYGAERFEGRSAMDWLRGVMDDPLAASRQEVIRIRHHDVKRFYGLDEDEKYFSLQDLSVRLVEHQGDIEDLLEVPEVALDPAQVEALGVYQKVMLLSGLMKGELLVHAEEADARRVQVEVWYNGFKPYGWAMVLYGLAALFAVFAVWRAQHLWLQFVPFVLMIGGGLAHSAAIAARVYILQRPPVGTLYESVLFVGLVCAVFAIVMSVRVPRPLYVLVGALSALGLLVLAPYSAPQGTGLELLVAVLNTNFWLTTHVLIITAGYGVCILTACLAHFAMVMRGRDLSQGVYRLSIVALLLMIVGTILGGIWADQSWGRFWGWDPKENGALLICLWLIWLQHGRHSGHLKGVRFLVGCAFLNVVVAVSWFGVNLLGVGLHSYGFVSGMAAGLGAFCFVQVALIAGLLMWRRRIV